MRDSYRKIFSIPGGLKFSMAALFGRIPAGMIGLAIILPLSKSMGSYMSAGAVAAATMIGMAFFAPISGRLVDRHGQSKILIIFSLANLIATALLIACAQCNAPFAVLCTIGALCGASRLSTGTMARTRWAFVIPKQDMSQYKESLQSAYAFESVIDEVVFISAPILATLLCTSVDPLAGLVCCLVSYVGGALALAMQYKTEPTIEPIRKKQSSALMISRLYIIFAAVLFIGVSAGAIEIIVVARADELGSRSLAGGLIATLAFSSMLSGFWYDTRRFKIEPSLLWIRCLGLLTLALVPFMFATNLVSLALALFVAGLSIAPTAISGQVLTERTIPTDLMNEGMSMIVTAMILGMALGSWLSGVLIDKIGTYLTGMLPLLATLAALIIASICSRAFTMPCSSTRT